jgi:hypothetical protein
MAWLCERASQMRCVRDPVLESRVIDVDFDDFLAHPATQLARIAKHFGLDGARTSDVLRGPVMTRYSKAPEHAYSPQLRREVMDSARVEHREQIKRGLAWLEDVARRNGAAAKVLTG